MLLIDACQEIVGFNSIFFFSSTRTLHSDSDHLKHGMFFIKIANSREQLIINTTMIIFYNFIFYNLLIQHIREITFEKFVNKFVRINEISLGEKNYTKENRMFYDSIKRIIRDVIYDDDE